MMIQSMITADQIGVPGFSVFFLKWGASRAPAFWFLLSWVVGSRAPPPGPPVCLRLGTL